MAGLPVTIRLLDPPLHEFLPTREEDFADVAEAAGVGIEALKARANELHEFNPMLGHRGCRLGVTYPEIYEMQARAIFEAACDVAAEKIGRASCRERVWQYVEITVVDVFFKKKQPDEETNTEDK